MSSQSWKNSFLKLAKNVVLKYLEIPYAYHIDRDELYELDNKAIEFLVKCNGSATGIELTDDDEFIDYCIEEELIDLLSEPQISEIKIYRSPVPSLRYLELQLLERCNLKCKHCYLGSPGKKELTLDDAVSITEEFSDIAGLRLIISGGEPMLYPQLKEFIKRTNDLQLRRILLTNGTLIDEKNKNWLDVEEIQFSLDGWLEGHDILRGRGSFQRTMRGIEIVHKAGIPISFSTMIHKGNIHEFERMRQFTDDIGVIEWGIDVLCLAGSLMENRHLQIPFDQAVKYMEYSFGGGYHGSSDGFACGRHLMTVMPNGMAVKCGFYADAPLGDARQSLKDSWLKLKHIPLNQLECGNCAVIDECAGGCRFRADNPLATDPVMCALYKVDSKG